MHNEWLKELSYVCVGLENSKLFDMYTTESGKIRKIDQKKDTTFWEILSPLLLNFNLVIPYIENNFD